MTNTFFTDVAKIRDVLATDEEPDRKLEVIKSLLSDPDVLREFWNKLESPAWIAPLSAEGFFEDPPQVEVLEGGINQIPNWPASKYLLRVVSKDPGGVAKVLANLETDNPSVMADLIDAANLMDAELAATLVPVLTRAARKEMLYFSYERAAELCDKLVADDYVSEALELASAMFKPSDELRRDIWNKRDEYSYKAAFNSVAPVLATAAPVPYLWQLCDWLQIAIRAKHYPGLEHGDDLSYSWRRAIEDHEENHDWDFAGTLVGFVRLGFEKALDSGAIRLDKALSILGGYSFTIYVRLRIHLIARYAQEHQALARRTMLNNVWFEDYRLKYEYAALVGKRFKLLTKKEQETWYAWINDGPDAAKYDQLFKDYRESEPTDEDREQRDNNWRFERLQWIKGYLTEDDRKFYKRILEIHDEAEWADMLSRTNITSIPTSPVDVEDLKGKSLAEVVQIIKNWQREELPDDRGRSLNGFAWTFSAYLEADSALCSRNAQELVDLHPIFVRTFISRMMSAIDADERIDVGAVLDLAAWVLDQPAEHECPSAAEGGSLVDRGWRWTREEIARFIEKVCEAKDDDRLRYEETDFRDRLWNLLERLRQAQPQLNNKSDSTEIDPRLGDYVNLSLNSPHGRAVRASLEYARWRANHHKKVQDDGQEVVPGGFDSMPEVREMLDDELNPDRRYVDAMASIGLNIGLIYWIDKEWLAQNTPQLFGQERRNQASLDASDWAAWNSFLVGLSPHVEFYRMFKSQFSYAVDQIASVEPAPGDHTRPMHRLGEHLIVLYGRGDLHRENGTDIFRQFIETAPADIRRHAISFAGSTLRREEKMPADVITRFMDLWDLYWTDDIGKKDAEKEPRAKLFGKWFATGQFPEQWALERLEQFVEVAPSPHPDGAVARKLLEIAHFDVDRSVRILDRIVRAGKESWSLMHWHEPALPILEQAMKANAESSNETRELAESLIDYFGRKGYLKFGDLLKS